MILWLEALNLFVRGPFQQLLLSKSFVFPLYTLRIRTAAIFIFEYWFLNLHPVHLRSPSQTTHKNEIMNPVDYFC